MIPPLFVDMCRYVLDCSIFALCFIWLMYLLLEINHPANILNIVYHTISMSICELNSIRIQIKNDLLQPLEISFDEIL